MNYKLQVHFLNDVTTWRAHILVLITMDIIKSPFLHQCRFHSNGNGFKIVQKSFIQSSSNLQEANHLGFSCQHSSPMSTTKTTLGIGEGDGSQVMHCISMLHFVCLFVLVFQLAIFSFQSTNYISFQLHDVFVISVSVLVCLYSYMQKHFQVSLWILAHQFNSRMLASSIQEEIVSTSKLEAKN